jgi:uncharacterized membrane protein YkvA (DUF1232 family)
MNLKRLRQEVDLYQRALRHPRTPRMARWLLGVALAYGLSPIDLIPDAIPLIGILDDLVLLPLLIALGLRLIPPEVLEELRRVDSDGGLR